MEECKDELRDMMELRKYHILSLTNSSEITCECDVCGHVWTAIIGNLKQGTGCPKCKKSRGEEKIEKWLDKFIYRFFTQQFKRSALPDGPKVGSISLSPRGDWRMPSDASFNSFK